MNNGDRPVSIGILGCGNICRAYLTGLSRVRSVRVVACADVQRVRAEAIAASFQVRAAENPDELLADPEVEIVVNLTPPANHEDVTTRAILAGKSVYTEKPIALTREAARNIEILAKKHAVMVSGAPDTVLGATLQTCRHLIVGGAIGRVVTASASMQCHGHENWHPDPAFHYQRGGGPLYDMGPYYIAALVMFMGPVHAVYGTAQRAFSRRRLPDGTFVDVEVDTHISALLEFSRGRTATLITSFDVWSTKAPPLEIHGERGSLACPDPDRFGGTPELWRNGSWETVPLKFDYDVASRGIGVVELARALRESRPPRIRISFLLHVIDVIQSILESVQSKTRHIVRSRCVVPSAMPSYGFE